MKEFEVMIIILISRKLNLLLFQKNSTKPERGVQAQLKNMFIKNSHQDCIIFQHFFCISFVFLYLKLKNFPSRWQNFPGTRFHVAHFFQALCNKEVLRTRWCTYTSFRILEIWKTGMDKVREWGAPLPQNEKENWGNQRINVIGIWRGVFKFKTCYWGRNHFIHSWIEKGI